MYIKLVCIKQSNIKPQPYVEGNKNVNLFDDIMTKSINND